MNLLAVLEFNDRLLIASFVINLVVLAPIAIRQQMRFRCLERKLDRIIAHQRGESLLPLSPEVRLMAKDPRKRVAAIRLHRDQHPGMTIADARMDIEELV